MTIAVPYFGHLIAPCFETSSNFIVAVAEDGKIILVRHLTCAGCRGFSRVSLLKEHDVDVLICGGIGEFYLNLLRSSNIKVVDQVSMNPEKAIDSFLRRELVSESSAEESENATPIPLEDLVCWARDLFFSNGYRISTEPDAIIFPIDFVAEIKCPVCGGQITIAVCCGAHTYKAGQELLEFQRVSSSGRFHGRIYIHPRSESVSNLCNAFGIELIDPFDETIDNETIAGSGIPLFKKPIIGHELASKS